MTVIRPNSISGVTSITAQTNALNFYDSAGATLSIGASVTGNITGDVTGNLIGNVTGDVNAGVITATTITGVSTIGVTTVTATNLTVNGNNIASAGPLSNRNLIINGAMQVAQRGTSQASVSSLGYYTVDRFQTLLNDLGTWTVSRETDAPNGFQYSLKHTCTTEDSSPASSDYAIIYQRFETQNVKNNLKYGTSSAQDVTLSFWVKSNKTGNASTGIFFSNSGTNRYISKQYQINNPNTWEYKTITFPPNTTLTMDLGDTEAGFFVEWWMNSGSNFSGGNHDIWSTSQTVRNASNLGVGGAISDYFAITGVQLEVGTVATPFEHRSYGDELARCQRYYYRHPAQNYRSALVDGNGTYACIFVSHPVRMRATPSISCIAFSSFYYNLNGTGHTGFNPNGSSSNVSYNGDELTGVACVTGNSNLGGTNADQITGQWRCQFDFSSEL